MYFSTPVKVPAVSGKIVRKKQGACTYVLFETERVYDPKRRFNVPNESSSASFFPMARTI